MAKFPSKREIKETEEKVKKAIMQKADSLIYALDEKKNNPSQWSGKSDKLTVDEIKIVELAIKYMIEAEAALYITAEVHRNLVPRSEGGLRDQSNDKVNDSENKAQNMRQKIEKFQKAVGGEKKEDSYYLNLE